MVSCTLAGAVLLVYGCQTDSPNRQWILMGGWSGCGVSSLLGVWAGWQILHLSRAIHAVADRFNSDEPDTRHSPDVTTAAALMQWIHAGLDNSIQDVQRLQGEVHDLQIQAQLTQRQRNNVEAIIHSLRDAVLVVDEEDRLLLANPSAGALFGFNWQFSDHEPIAHVIPQDGGALLDFLRGSRKNNVDATRRQIAMGPEDDPRTFDCMVSCVRHAGRPHCSLVAVLHDVTREKEVSEVKDDFVSYVSHELKTPLASITAYAEMLLDGEADNDTMRREFYTVIQGQAKRLNRLIENILNVSRIESGLMRIEKETLSLAVLIEENLPMIRSFADDRNIKIIGQKPIVYDQVFADRDMMSQVIINLLSNAIKYNCPGGSVTIETDVDETRSVACVKVTDTGVGISEEELAQVFDKFFRSRANENQAEGTGLGLNLVRQIVEKMHDGRVFAHSQVGAGSTFGFELPLATRQDVAS